LALCSILYLIPNMNVPNTTRYEGRRWGIGPKEGPLISSHMVAHAVRLSVGKHQGEGGGIQDGWTDRTSICQCPRISQPTPSYRSEKSHFLGPIEISATLGPRFCTNAQLLGSQVTEMSASTSGVCETPPTVTGSRTNLTGSKTNLRLVPRLGRR
jgi:hypothetical protein